MRPHDDGCMAPRDDVRLEYLGERVEGRELNGDTTIGEATVVRVHLRGSPVEHGEVARTRVSMLSNRLSHCRLKGRAIGEPASSGTAINEEDMGPLLYDRRGRV